MKQSRRAKRALNVAVVYLVLAVLAHRLRWPLKFTFTWWLVAIVAALFYVALVQAVAPRAPQGRRILGIVVLGVLHAALGLATAVAYALVGAPFATALRDAFWAFAPATLLQMLSVPLIASQLRVYLQPRPAARAAAARRYRGVAPMPPRQAEVAWPVTSLTPPAVPEPLVDHWPAVADTVTAVVPKPPMTLPATLEPQGIALASLEPARIEMPTYEPPAPVRVSATVVTVPEVPLRIAASAPAVAEARGDKRAATIAAVLPEMKLAQPALMAETPRTPQTLRIPFSTIAAQLPDDLFRMPAGEVGARLSTPDHVLVPVTLVLPQLAEGFVEVRWDAIGHQFPDSVLARPARETAARVRAAITLPLDEIVAQLPADLFADAGRVVDTTHLENFPLPFQPATDTRAEEPAPEPVAATTATPLDRAAPAPVVAPAHESPSVPAVEVEEPAPVIEPVVVQVEAVIQAETPVIRAEASMVQAEAPMVQAEAPVVQAEAPMVQPEGPVVQAEAPVVQDQAPAIQDEAPVVQDEPWVQDQAPVDDGDGVAEAVVEEEPYGLVAAEHAETRVPPRAVEPRGAEPSPVALRKIRALFARLNRLEIDAEYVDGVTLYRACSPDVGAEAIRELAARLLPFLRDGWSGPVEQITVRGARAAIVLTALGGPDAAGQVLAAGTGRGPSLGLIELLGRRGAATWPTASAGGYALERAARGRAGAARGGADASSHLIRGIVDTDLARLTPALAAFGHVVPACFDAAGGARVYAFVDPDLAASGVAAFAHDLLEAVTAAEGARDLGRVESVTCRRGAGQLMVRAVTGGAPRLVVAAGAVARPGRAHGQLECAAAALGAGQRD